MESRATAEPRPSNLRHAVTSTSPTSPDQSHQFAQKPRFSSRTSHPADGSPSIAAHHALSEATSGGFKVPLKRTESINDSSPAEHSVASSGTEQQDEDAQRTAISPELLKKLQEQPHNEVEAREQERLRRFSYDVVHSPKRRRLSPPVTPARADVAAGPSSANANVHGVSHTPRRFLPSGLYTPANRPPSSSSASIAPASSVQSHHKPPFLLPPEPTQAAEPADPLPDVFSPHRRGKKFVPGGMAETLRDWIVDVSRGLQRQGATDYGRWDDGGGHDNAGRLKILAVEKGDSGRDGVALIRGEWSGQIDSMDPTERNDELRAILVGSGDARGPSTDGISPGAIVSPRPPHWTVDIQGEKWMVCADWRIAS